MRGARTVSAVVAVAATLALASSCRDIGVDDALRPPPSSDARSPGAALAAAAPTSSAGAGAPTTPLAPAGAAVVPSSGPVAAPPGPEAAAVPPPGGGGAPGPASGGGGSQDGGVVLRLDGSGAPSGAAPPAGAASGPAGPAADDAAAVRQALALVVDLTVPFEQKAPHLEQAEALRPVHDQYVALVRPLAGQLAVRVSDIAIVGDRATFSFDLLGPGGMALAAGLPGEARRVGDLWQVSRGSFCSALALANLGCPA